MTLGPGVNVGPYEIVSRIGAGGMGEVFKARDGRLERYVAIKFLPASLSNDANLRLRFKREAKAISKLNHSHICQVYDVGEVKLEGRASADSYLVMEFLESAGLWGQTFVVRTEIQ